MEAKTEHTYNIKNKILCFNYKNISIEFKKGEFITVLGNNNEDIILSSFKSNDKISYKEILNFKNLKVADMLKKYCKNNNDLKTYINAFKLNDYKNEYINNLNINEKIKLKILICYLSNEVIIFNNILSLVDYSDYKLIMKFLKNNRNDKIVINFTNNVNESLFGDKILIIYNNKLICYSNTLDILKEEKVFKRLKIGLPFIIELNKYLIDYNLIDNYYLSYKKLVGELWK